jgi:release factor glutamine methyltransferase
MLFVVMTDIYDPEEDSFMFAKLLQEYLKRKTLKKTLEIGIGSGILSQVIAPHSKKHIGVDINPFAIDYVKKLLPECEIKKSDLFEEVKGEFDLIVFNAPYLPASKNDAPGWITVATVAGKRGNEIILRFIDELDGHLSDDGICFLLFSSYSKPNEILKHLTEMMYSATLTGERKSFMETLYIYKIEKTKARKIIEEKGVSNMKYLTHGHRGQINTGTYKNKKVAIKTIYNNKSPVSIIKEAKHLQEVNKIGIGPKYYFHTEEVICFEFVEGTLIRYFLETATKAEKKRVFDEIMRQCVLMDKAGIQKEEMTHPYKHIIVTKKSAVLIDFERSKYSLKPHNVNQFTEYIKRMSK